MALHELFKRVREDTLSHAHTHTLPLSLTHTHTHTRTLPHTHTICLTHTHVCLLTPNACVTICTFVLVKQINGVPKSGRL